MQPYSAANSSALIARATCLLFNFAFFIDATTTDIIIDTRELTPTAAPSCGALNASGPDGFIGVNVLAGSTWHFHLTLLEGTDVEGEINNPSLYLIANGCNTRTCEELSDSCRTRGEEHFAFVPSSDGDWYVGIDDSASGGGRYRLDAYLTVCGNGVFEHGEACDPTAPGSPPCTMGTCRKIVDTTNTLTTPPNQNLVEASLLMPDENGELEFRGTVGDSTGECSYPSVYAFQVGVPSFLQVQQKGCAVANDAPFVMTLLTAGGTEITRSERDAGTGCPLLDVDLDDPGTYFISLQMEEGFDATVANFDLEFSMEAQ